MVAPLLAHRVDLDVSGTGTIEGDGTVGALAGHTVGALRGMTVGDLRLIVSSETVTRLVLAEPAPAAERGRDRTAPDAPPLANELVYTLDNRGMRVLGVGSPVAPGVQIGRGTRWLIASGGTTYAVATGVIKEGIADTAWGAERVQLRALSQLARLVDRRGYSSPLYGNGTQAGGVRTDVALGYVLDAAGLTDPARRVLDVGDTILNWFWIAPEDDLFDLAVKIWAAEGPGARLYDDADGRTVFKRRSSEVTESRFTTSQATFRDRDDGIAAWYQAWTPTSGERLMVNRATMAVVRRALDPSLPTVARAGGTITLQPSETRAVALSTVLDLPVASMVVPASPADYRVTAGSLTSITLGPRTSGVVVDLTFTAGAAGATIEGPSADPDAGLIVHGTPLRVTGRGTIADAGVDTAESIASHGLHTFTIRALEDVDPLVAQSLCNSQVLRGMTPRPTAVVAVPLVADRNVAAALGRQVGDRITVINERALFARTMWVEALRVVGSGGATVVELMGQSTSGLAGPGAGGWSVGLWSQATWGT
jgi:hypothetical protein